MTAAEPTPLVVFTPSGRRGRVRRRHDRCSTPRARSASTSTRSAAGAASAAAARSSRERGRVRQARRSSSAPTTSSPFGDARGRRYRDEQGLAAGPPPRRARRRSCGDVVIDVPPESQVHRQVVRKDADAHAIERRPGRPAPLRRGRASPTCAIADRRPAAAARGARARVGARPASTCDLARRCAACSRRCARATGRSPSRSTTAATIIARLAGLPRRRATASPSTSARPRSPAISATCATGEVLASRRRDEPADPLRRGPDEPRLLRDDEPGRRGGADRGGPRGARRADRRALRARPASTRDDILELTLVGNPIMHHLAPRHRPDRARRRAVRARHRRGACDVRRRELGLDAHPGARVYVLPCIAGHVGADTAGVILVRGARTAATTMTLLVDVGTNAEIVLGNRDRLLAASSPTGPAFEGAQICCGQRAAPGAIERVRIDPRDARAALPGDRRRRWSDEPGFAERPPTGVTGICGSGIIEVDRRDVSSPASSPTDGVIDGALAARTPRIVADGRTFSYVLHDGEPRRSRSPRTTSARSSSPRPRSMPACRLLMDQLGHRDASTRSGWPARSAATSTRCTRWCSGLIPDCDLDQRHVAPATPPAPARASRC